MKDILIRADDLGYSEAINYGIEKTVKEGIIRNVGFMVNMDASRHGFERIAGEDIALGLHTNICVGRPVSDPGLLKSIVRPDGEFKSSREYRNSKEDFVVLGEVLVEIEAQYQRFKEITGREPDYFEGHAVSSLNFIKGLRIIAERHNLRYSDINFDNEPIYLCGRKAYIWLESTSNPEYDPQEMLERAYHHGHDDGIEILVFHPGYLDQYLLRHSSLTVPRTLEAAMCCSEKTRLFLSEHDIRLLRYDDL